MYVCMYVCIIIVPFFPMKKTLSFCMSLCIGLLRNFMIMNVCMCYIGISAFMYVCMYGING